MHCQLGDVALALPMDSLEIFLFVIRELFCTAFGRNRRCPHIRVTGDKTHEWLKERRREGASCAPQNERPKRKKSRKRRWRRQAPQVSGFWFCCLQPHHLWRGRLPQRHHDKMVLPLVFLASCKGFGVSTTKKATRTRCHAYLSNKSSTRCRRQCLCRSRPKWPTRNTRTLQDIPIGPVR